LIHSIDHTLTGVGGKLHNAGVHSDGVFRTRLNTKSAKNAYAQIDVENFGHLLDVGIRMFDGSDVDASRGAHGLAHHTGYASGCSVRTLCQPVAGPQATGEGAPLLGVLNGYRIPFSDLQAQRAKDMTGKVIEEVPGSKSQAFGNLRYIQALEQT
jgi:hypothetical protein